MSDKKLKELIPWLANESGEVSAEERRAIEEHLASSGDLRELEAVARLLADSSVPASLDLLLETVHPRLVVAYAEDPNSLQEETRNWIEQRMSSDSDLKAEIEALRRADRTIESQAINANLASPAAEPRESLWAWMQRTALHPVPAAGYLTAAAALAIFLLLPGGEDGSIATTTQPFVLFGQQVVRGGSIAISDAVLPASDAVVLLQLETGLTKADVDDAQASFALEVQRGEEVVYTEQVARHQISIRNNRAVFFLLLRPGQLTHGELHEVVVRIQKPGDLLDGQEIFTHRVVLE